MEFINNPNTRVAMSSRKGEVDATEDQLVDVFGEPENWGDDPDSDGKVTKIWTLLFADGTVATIYDYCGFCWSIGGYDRLAAQYVHEALNGSHKLVERLT